MQLKYFKDLWGRLWQWPAELRIPNILVNSISQITAVTTHQGTRDELESKSMQDSGFRVI